MSKSFLRERETIHKRDAKSQIIVETSEFILLLNGACALFATTIQSRRPLQHQNRSSILMILVSNSPSDSEWLLPTVTNNYEARLARRKRSLDEACEEKQELTKMHTRRSNKKTKVEGSLQDVLNASNASNACIDRAPHEVLAGAGDWIFEPLQVVEDNELVTGDTAPSHEAVDVGKVISILLAAISASRRRDESPEPPARSHRPHPTSPLSNSYYRTPFIRKSVGGPRRGRIEPGLRKWVMCKNHVEE